LLFESGAALLYFGLAQVEMAKTVLDKV